MVYFISGEQGEGKTTFLRKTVSLLKSAGYRVHGFIANPVNENNRRVAFYLQDVNSEVTKLLCDTEHHANDLIFGKYAFKKNGFTFGEQLINRGMQDKNRNRIFILDEIGRLELNDQGWNAVFSKLIAENVDVVCTVRSPFIDEVVNYYKLQKKFCIFNILNTHASDLVKAVGERKGI